MLCTWHVQPTTPSTASVCVGSCREETHKYTRLPHAYGGHHPSALAPKHRGRYANEQMPNTAPRTQTSVLVSLTRSLSVQHARTDAEFAPGPGSDPWAFVEWAFMNIYSLTPHTHTEAACPPERGWRWVRKEKSADLSAGTKVIFPTKSSNTQSWAQLNASLSASGFWQFIQRWWLNEKRLVTRVTTVLWKKNEWSILSFFHDWWRQSASQSENQSEVSKRTMFLLGKEKKNHIL